MTLHLYDPLLEQPPSDMIPHHLHMLALEVERIRTALASAADMLDAVAMMLRPPEVDPAGFRFGGTD